MSQENYCSFIGNLTADPVGRNVNDGKGGETRLVTFSLGVNNRRSKTVSYPDLEVWATQAGLIEKYCRKGDKIAVSGEYRIEKYENKDGEVRYKHKFRVDDFTFLGKKGGGSSQPEADEEEEAQPQPKTKSKPKAKPAPPVENDDDDDIPF